MSTQWPDIETARPVLFSWGAGRMARATAGHDWAGTPLGPVEGWSTALMTTVRMMLSQRHAMCMFWGPELTMLYNDAYAPLLGAKEGRALGAPFRQIWSDVWADVEPLVIKALSGESTFSQEMRLVMTRNGYEEETFWTFSYGPLFDDQGQVAGLLNVTVDVTPNVMSRRNQQILQAELLHRIRNILTVTSTVVSATLRNATSLPQARDSVAARIMALAKAQGLLTELGDRAEIGHVVEQSIAAHIDDWQRVTRTGPPLSLTSQQAVGLSLALYELATNATKYGALRDLTGHISIGWQTDPAGGFRFDWRESGVAGIGPAARTGFGSRLTTVIVPAYFEGQGRTVLHPDGLHYTLEGKLSH
ncbi:MAG: sensor histidine kinase [Paracoccus sp. (in: a-proteobacteria)]|uniref:sensor histidine kinase n=1 Tax=Paracoccus sp. TaxID=267 RepID=UPI00391AC2A3